MNIKQFLTGLFRGQSSNGELDQVRNAARQDAQLYVGTYLEEFESEATKLLMSRQRRLTGFTEEEEGEEEVIEGSYETETDYSEYSRPQLMNEAKSKGLEYDRSVTKDELLQLLNQ